MKTVGKVKDAGVTPIAVLLGLILIPINNLWITIIEVRWYALDGTCLPLFITPIFILFAICLVNLAFRRLLRVGLSRGELLTIYIMIVTGACLASHDMIQNLFGTLGHPAHFSNETNQYDKLFWRYLPHNGSLFVWDKVALKGFYGGGMSPYTWDILQYWVKPLAFWGSLVIVLIAMMLAINVLIRKQWTENEKLVFPLVQLPMAMAAEDAGRKFFGNRLMWIGFGIAFLIGLINGLHVLYPSMPVIEGVKAYSLATYFVDRPWSAINRIRECNVTMYPFMIGLTYFIPLDLSFSCWFFYVARKLYQVFGAVMGWDAAGTSAFPYWEAQSSGAWLALSAIIVIGTLPHVKSVWRLAFGDANSPDDMAEAGLYRKSFYVLGLGSIFLIILSKYMGLPVYLAIIFFALYFLLSIAMTRVRAELGTPHEIYFVNPGQIMLSLLGFNAIGIANMTVLQSMYWFNRCYRSHPMPNQLEAMKMAEGTKIKLKPLIFVLMLSAVVGLLTSYWANLHVTYSAGASAKCIGYKWWVGAESFDRLSNWIKNKPTTDLPWMLNMVGGGLMVVGLKAMRGAFVGWPFHPAGYALAISFAMDYFWFAIFVGWLMKLIIIRYGGMKLHNACVPFFMGLILGDFTIGSIWAIIGPLINQQAYKIFI